MYLLAAYYAGLYDRKYKRPRLIRSTRFIATITLLAAYSLLPESYRFFEGNRTYWRSIVFYIDKPASPRIDELECIA